MLVIYDFFLKKICFKKKLSGILQCHVVTCKTVLIQIRIDVLIWAQTDCNGYQYFNNLEKKKTFKKFFTFPYTVLKVFVFAVDTTLHNPIPYKKTCHFLVWKGEEWRKSSLDSLISLLRCESAYKKCLENPKRSSKLNTLYLLINLTLSAISMGAWIGWDMRKVNPQSANHNCREVMTSFVVFRDNDDKAWYFMSIICWQMIHMKYPVLFNP